MDPSRSPLRIRRRPDPTFFIVKKTVKFLQNRSKSVRHIVINYIGVEKFLPHHLPLYDSVSIEDS
jgi:hypothetical protein